MTLARIAELLGAELADPATGGIEIVALNTPQAARPGELVVAFDRDAVLAGEQSQAAALVVPRGLACARPHVAADNPRRALPLLLDLFAPAAPAPAGVHPRAVVDASARLGADVTVEAGAVVAAGVELGDRCRVGANSVVGAECRLGADTVLHANVTLYPRTVVGARVTIHSGAVLGAAGYGYRQDGGRHVPIPQLGVVVIEDEVDIGANTCIDRATIGETRIGAGTKIDNLVQIAHNCSLGRACLVIGQVGMGGSCEVGDGVVLAGQVGLADHVTIGSGARVGAQSGVAREVPAGGRYVGTPAVPAVEAHRIHLAWRRLPGMLRAWQATRTASEGEVGDAP